MKTKLLILAVVIISAQSIYALRLRASAELHAQQIETLTRERDQAQQRYADEADSVTAKLQAIMDQQNMLHKAMGVDAAAAMPPPGAGDEPVVSSNVILQPATPPQ